MKTLKLPDFNIDYLHQPPTPSVIDGGLIELDTNHSCNLETYDVENLILSLDAWLSNDRRKLVSFYHHVPGIHAEFALITIGGGACPFLRLIVSPRNCEGRMYALDLDYGGVATFYARLRDATGTLLPSDLATAF